MIDNLDTGICPGKDVVFLEWTKCEVPGDLAEEFVLCGSMSAFAGN